MGKFPGLPHCGKGRREGGKARNGRNGEYHWLLVDNRNDDK